jgi:hypothetical protein
MHYAKPEVAVLGKAVRVIESHTAKSIVPMTDGGQLQLNAAYDLDE